MYIWENKTLYLYMLLVHMLRQRMLPWAVPFLVKVGKEKRTVRLAKLIYFIYHFVKLWNNVWICYHIISKRLNIEFREYSKYQYISVQGGYFKANSRSV